MLVELLMALGLVTSFQPGDSCIDALHELRVMERMRIQSAEVLDDNVIAYTLTDGPRINSKTAILVCVRDVEDEEALDEADEEEMALEDLEEAEEVEEAEGVEETEEVEEADEEVEPLEEDDEEAAE